MAGAWAPGVLVNPDPSAEPTRPSLLLDTENNEVYVVSCCNAGSSSINSFNSQARASRAPE